MSGKFTPTGKVLYTPLRLNDQNKTKKILRQLLLPLPDNFDRNFFMELEELMFAIFKKSSPYDNNSKELAKKVFKKVAHIIGVYDSGSKKGKDVYSKNYCFLNKNINTLRDQICR